MPVVSLSLPEIHATVSRPVCQSILNQVREITKIPSDTKVYYPGEIAIMQTPGSAVDAKQDRQAVFNTGRYTFIEVTQNYNPDTLATTAVSQIEHPPIFIDDALGVVFSPVYATTDVEISVRYRTHSRVEAKRWMQDIRMRVSQMRDVFLHSVAFYYIVPPQVEELVEEIHSKREAVAGYSEDFSHYVRKHFTPRATVVSDSTGKNKRLAIREAQARIQGVFGFDGGLPDKPERDGQSGTYQASFTYKFTYDQPIGLTLRYPIMVHNQLLESRYIEFDYDGNDDNVRPYDRSVSSQAFAVFEAQTVMNKIFKDYAPIRMPQYDDFVLPATPVSQSEVMTVLCSLGDDRKTLFNLKDLMDNHIDPDVLEFIQGVERNHICKPYGSMISLELFRGKYRASQDSLEINSDLDVLSKEPLNLRTQHRVQLSVVNDLALVPRAFFDRIREYPKAFVAILSGLNPILNHSVNFKSLYHAKQIYSWQVSEVFEYLTGYSMNGETKVHSDLVGLRQHLKLLDDIPHDVYKMIMTYRARMKTQMTNAVLVYRLDKKPI